MATIAEVFRPPIASQGIWSWVTTVDHKRIGVLYGVTAFVWLLVGGIEALLMRLQLAVPDNKFVNPETFNQLFTMHGTTMVFLVVMPLSAAFFNYVVPLMIGARDVAFPRLNAFSYWVFLVGGILLNLSWLAGEAPDQGWFAYANLTERPFSPGRNVDFWVLGIQVLGIASIAAALNFFVTIVNMRAPGMSLMRTPVFVWMTLVTSVLILLAFPPLTVALIEIMFDRLFGTNFFSVAAGGDPVLWQHLFWIFGHPEVYILILPSMGIVSEVLPTFSRKPLFGYPFVVYSGIAIAFLSFGVWAHHMFAVGLGPIANSFFAISTMLIAIPTGVKIFNWIGTLYGGAIERKTALYFAVGFVAQFIIGGITGVMHASPPVDWQQTDTYFVVAHFHYVLVGGALFGLFAGLYYWWPKMTGRLLNERLGKINFWLMVIGFNTTFFPMHFLGVDGMPRRIYTYSADMGWNEWNFVSTVGAFILGLAVLVFLVNVVRSVRAGEGATADPWDGRTLEWSTSSPPPPYNFAKIPVVHSRDAYWEQKYAHPGARWRGGSGDHVPPRIRGGAGPAQAGDEEHDVIHMPNPSYFPVLVAIGLFLLASGLLFGYAISFAGLVVTFVGVYGWALEPASQA